ncbi:MAG TPA: hypothetical protein PLR12_08390, partial [Clostridia bacterium]|nr:hypothetical protein [Clostridia bacterium]
RADVHVRLVALKFLFRHGWFLLLILRYSAGQKPALPGNRPPAIAANRKGLVERVMGIEPT